MARRTLDEIAPAKARRHRAQIKLRHGIVLDHRVDGLSWGKIAELTGYTVEAAQKAFLQETGVDPAQIRAEGRLLQRLRLERLTKLTMRAARSRSLMEAIDAIPAALRVMERHAKLDGLDEPTKSETELKGALEVRATVTLVSAERRSDG